MRRSTRAGIAAAMALLGVSCGDDSDSGAAGSRPTVVVTSNVLGDVVTGVVGDGFDVVTIMPVGADPHDFQASARQVAQIGEADVLIVNGAGFEQGLVDVIEAAEADGVPVFEAVGVVETIEFGAYDDHDEHEEDGEHDHEGVDPHFFTDPARMAVVADAIAEFVIATVDGIDIDAVRTGADASVAELEAVDRDVEETLGAIPAERRVLVTNHEVFNYFADRYGFEVVGTVIPGGGTGDGTSARDLTELAEVIEHEDVPAVFADTSASDELARTLAVEVGDVAVVQLYSESLGAEDSDGATYPEMMRANARRIADALAG